MKIVQIIDKDNAYIFNIHKSRRQVFWSIFFHPVASLFVLFIVGTLLGDEITNIISFILALFTVVYCVLAIPLALLNLIVFILMKTRMNKRTDVVSVTDAAVFHKDKGDDSKDAIPEKMKQDYQLDVMSKTIENQHDDPVVPRKDHVDSSSIDESVSDDFGIFEVLNTIEYKYKTDVYPDEVCLLDEIVPLVYIKAAYKQSAFNRISIGVRLKLLYNYNERFSVFTIDNLELGEISKKNSERLHGYLINKDDYYIDAVLNTTERYFNYGDVEQANIRLKVYGINEYKRMVETKCEETICNSIANYLYSSRNAGGVFEVESGDEYTSLLYKGITMIRIRVSSTEPWLRLIMPKSLNAQYSDDVLFIKQTNKNELYWIIELNNYSISKLKIVINDCFDVMEIVGD